MAIKQQLAKLKENWLILVLVLIVLIFMSGGTSLFESVSMLGSEKSYSSYGGSYNSYEGGLPAPSRSIPSMAEKSYDAGGTAPQTKERKVVKTSSLSTEVETGTFDLAASKVKKIAESSDSIILNEYVSAYETERKTHWHRGEYQIKVDVKKYDSVIAQLKAVGEIKQFRESQDDITEAYEDAEIELNAEKERLKRYQDIYKESDIVSDKIELTDLIFEQERRIEYMEEALKMAGERVQYATVYVTVTEKQPDYSNIVFVKLTALAEKFVGSLNSLISMLVSLAPWAVAVWIIRLIWKKVKGKKVKA